MKTKITALILTFTLLFSINSATFAETISGLQEKKDEATEQKKEVQENKSEAMKEIESLSSSIMDNEDKLEELSNKLSDLNNEIKSLENQIKEKEKEYDEKNKLVEERIVVQYKYGDTSYLDVLLNSYNVIDFISNYYIVKEVMEYDKELLNSIEEEKTKIEEDKKSLEEKQRTYKSQKAEQERTNATLKNQKIKKENYISKLSNEEKELSKKIDEYNAAIKQLEEEARRASQNSNGDYVGGVMLWPCPSSKRITSYFGGRKSPGGVGSTNHKGIDIGASSGAAIVAALDGTVVGSGKNRARGNYLMIDHGGGVITLYQHGLDNSKRVKIGDKVKKGQTIMGVGSTGYSTGNHLHFEVIVKGVNVDPLTYLT